LDILPSSCNVQRTISTAQSEAMHALPIADDDFSMMDHRTTASWPVQGANSLETKITKTLNDTSNPPEWSQPVPSPLVILIQGLPENTIEANLRTLMAWSCDFLEARLITTDSSWLAPGFSSAVFRFSTHSGAKLAMELFDGKSNIDATAYLSVQFTSDNSYFSELAPAEDSHPTKRRHKWIENQVAFLQEKFSSNPKPSMAAKQEIAAQLVVKEKHVHTWYNNARQRQKSGGKSESLRHGLLC
jgi:hypothetical protein